MRSLAKNVYLKLFSRSQPKRHFGATGGGHYVPQTQFGGISTGSSVRGSNAVSGPIFL